MWQHVANHISWSHNQTCFEHHFEQLSTWRGPCIGYHSFRCCRCQVEGKSPYPRISFKTWMLPLWASSTIFYDTIRSCHDRTYLTYHHRSIAMLQKELNDTKLNWKNYTILFIPKKTQIGPRHLPITVSIARSSSSREGENTKSAKVFFANLPENHPESHIDFGISQILWDTMGHFLRVLFSRKNPFNKKRKSQNGTSYVNYQLIRFNLCYWAFLQFGTIFQNIWVVWKWQRT